MAKAVRELISRDGGTEGRLDLAATLVATMGVALAIGKLIVAVIFWHGLSQRSFGNRRQDSAEFFQAVAAFADVLVTLLATFLIYAALRGMAEIIRLLKLGQGAPIGGGIEPLRERFGWRCSACKRLQMYFQGNETTGSRCQGCDAPFDAPDDESPGPATQA